MTTNTDNGSAFDTEQDQSGDHTERATTGTTAATAATTAATAGPAATTGITTDLDHVEAGRPNPGSLRARCELASMEQTPRQKQWTIPSQADKGPVNITLRLPNVRVDDSAGRHIEIGPEQADVLGSRLTAIRDWLQIGHEDWVGDDDQER